MAKALASGPLALSLYHGVANLSENDLRTYLLTWRLDLEEELLSDPHGALGWTLILQIRSHLHFLILKFFDSIHIPLHLASI